MENILIIAGHDPSGAAGIVRDVKTATKLGVHPLTVVTAITYQNVSGIFGLKPLAPEEVVRQITPVLDDFKVEYAKIGMLPTGEVAKKVTEILKKWEIKAVVDPVLRATAGAALAESVDSLIPVLKNAYVITPNVPEAEMLSGISIKSREDMVRAGKLLEDEYGCTIIKGGHLSGEDILFCEEMHASKGSLKDYNVRGTGCAYSTALASFLARGYGLPEAFANAHLFIQKEIEHAVKTPGGYVLP